MKIALIGYGQMGKAIEKIAVNRGHEIVLTIDRDNMSELSAKNLNVADVAIEFSRPESAFKNYMTCFQGNVPVVSGTTGWLDKMDEVISQCDGNKCGFFYASNFSLGVNLFFELNRKLAKLMNPFDEYRVSMNEIHHTRKLDAPSGTAITLAEGVINDLDRVASWKLGDEAKQNELPISAERIGDVPGTHEVFYTSAIDEITIRHEAKSREGFALGAVLAAEFMQGKTGFYGMQDLLKL